MRFRVGPVRAPVLSWLEERVGTPLTPEARGIVAVDATGRVRGMVAYDGWTESAAEAHMAVDAPAAWRALVRPAFVYPFLQAGRRVLLGRIRASNTASLRMAMHLGFAELARVRDGAREGEDLVLVQMRREDCRWLSSGRWPAGPRNDTDAMLEA